MNSAFGLKTKGLVLVFVPLVFQLIFVAILIFKLVELQDQLLLVTKSRDLVTKAHNISNDVVAFTVRSFFEGRESKHRLIDQGATRAKVRSLRRPFDKLVEETLMVPEQRDNALALQRCAKNFERVFQEICDHQNKGLEHWIKVSPMYDLKIEYAMMNFLERVSKMIDTEKGKRTQEGFVAKFKTEFAQITIAALIANVIVSAGLGIAFAFKFRKPIKHIEENSKRMSQRRELLPPLSSADELGELDRCLHTAAEGIEEAFSKEQSMVEEAVDMICIIGADGRFRRVNPATTALTGWAPADLLLQTVFDLVHPEDITRADEEFTRAKETSSRASFDLRLRCKNGQLLETRWSCIYSSSNEEMFAVVHDITDEKNVERLKEDFLDMITHDLRSPLSSMLGSLTLVQEGVRGEISPAVRKELGVAMTSVEHLAALVNDLLDFQKLSAGKMVMVREDHDFDGIVTDSLNMLQEIAQKKRVTFSKNALGVSLNCDRMKLAQVLNNLISNAIKFSPEDSVITITRKKTTEVCEGSRVPLDFLEVHILDCGNGVPEHLSEKIFEAFERLPGERKEGTGLGLAICKMVIEAHGGRIGVNSGSAGGDFWFKMPLVSNSDSHYG